VLLIIQRFLLSTVGVVGVAAALCGQRRQCSRVYILRDAKAAICRSGRSVEAGDIEVMMGCSVSHCSFVGTLPGTVAVLLLSLMVPVWLSFG
jgi:hypothetical protein